MKGELFSQQFIPKLLDGTKVRTSRPMKPQPIKGSKYGGINIYGQAIFYPQNESDYDIEDGLRKPKYQSGDVMYARETFREFSGMYYGWQGGAYIPLDDFSGYNYKADDMHMFTKGANPFIGAFEDMKDDTRYGKWRPSIHMPREAARIFLRVTDVKVQRLDDLTEQDAIEDGFEAVTNESEGWALNAIDRFNAFWTQQYGPSSRWMWVYYFKLISKDEALGGTK